MPDEKRAVAAAPVEGRPAQVEGAGSSEDEQALGAGEARLAQRKGKRADYEVRSGQLGRSDADAIAGDENVRTTPRSEAVTLSATAAPAASAPELNCTAIWISSTRIALREDAPADASERLSTLVESLQGRLVSEPESALMLPAPRLGEFVASLPVTGHAFVGPSPQIPRDRDCITFRFASIAIDSPEP